MFFLLRMAFWIGLICLLLPGSREDNARLITSAEETVKDVRGFCVRNPQVCEDVRLSMTTLLTRFRSGAELLQNWLAQQKTEGDGHETVVERTPAPPSPGRNAPAPQPVTKWQDSLNTADRQVPWRGPGGL